MYFETIANKTVNCDYTKSLHYVNFNNTNLTNKWVQTVKCIFTGPRTYYTQAILIFYISSHCAIIKSVVWIVIAYVCLEIFSFYNRVLDFGFDKLYNAIFYLSSIKQDTNCIGVVLSILKSPCKLTDTGWYTSGLTAAITSCILREPQTKAHAIGCMYRQEVSQLCLPVLASKMLLYKHWGS